MQCKRASFTSLREDLQAATVRIMNGPARTIADLHIVCTDKGTFTDAGLSGHGVYPYMPKRRPGGRA